MRANNLLLTERPLLQGIILRLVPLILWLHFLLATESLPIQLIQLGYKRFSHVFPMACPLELKVSGDGMHSPTLKDIVTKKLLRIDFGRGRLEPHSTQFNEKVVNKDAANWFRVNPHRLHLGIVGLELSERVTPTDFTDIHQTLDMWKGVIHSSYKNSRCSL